MAVLVFHIALAHDNARPERREIRNATLEHSVGNFAGCSLMKSTTWRRKPPQSAASPALEAGMTMGLTDS